MRALPSPASPRVERVKTDCHTLLLPLITVPYAFVKEQHLCIHLVFLQLPSYIFGYLRLVLSHSIYILPPAPELPIPIPVFHPLPALIYHQAPFPLDISHYTCRIPVACTWARTLCDTCNSNLYVIVYLCHCSFQ